MRSGDLEKSQEEGGQECLPSHHEQRSARLLCGWVRGQQESSLAPCRLPLPPPPYHLRELGQTVPMGKVGKHPMFSQAAPECSATSPGAPDSGAMGRLGHQTRRGEGLPSAGGWALRMDVHRVGEGVQWKEAVPWSGPVWLRGPSLVLGLVQVTVCPFTHSLIHLPIHSLIHSLTTLCHTSLLATPCH